MKNNRTAISMMLMLISTVMVANGVSASGTTQSIPQLTRLELDLNIDYEHRQLAGHATLELSNTSDRAMKRLPLLLGRLMKVRDASVDGRPLIFQQRVATFDEDSLHQVVAVEVELLEPLPPGTSTRLRVDYDGHVVGYTETGMLYVQDRIAPEFTILREESGAFPMPGSLSIAANRAAQRGDFAFDVAVTVPALQTVALGGELLERKEVEGRTRFRYRSIAPARFVNISIAPYGLIEDEKVRIFHFAGDKEGAQSLLAGLQRASQRFDEIFGPRVQTRQKLHLIQIPTGYGSQASLGAGVILEASAFRERSEWDSLYHELSHLWNARDLEGRLSPRWNEGLATFLQLRLTAELDGWDGEAAYRERSMKRLVKDCATHPVCAHTAMRDYGRERLTDFSYRVGYLMFATLYDAMGAAAFDQALRQHFQSTREQGTRTDDLIRSFVAVGGEPARLILTDWLDSTAWQALFL